MVRVNNEIKWQKNHRGWKNEIVMLSVTKKMNGRRNMSKMAYENKCIAKRVHEFVMGRRGA